MSQSKYNDNVFINCPFDAEYRHVFRALVFAIHDCGFVPRCSLEISDGTTARLDSIYQLIRTARYGVHDLSRVQLDKQKLPRFNMPFELGLFPGAKGFGDERQGKKNCLVLERAQYRYKKFLSDISGIDAVPHHDSRRKAVLAIREWLKTSSRRKSIPPGEGIWRRYQQFEVWHKRECKSLKISVEEMSFVDYSENVVLWLRANEFAPNLLRIH